MVLKEIRSRYETLSEEILFVLSLQWGQNPEFAFFLMVSGRRLNWLQEGVGLWKNIPTSDRSEQFPDEFMASIDQSNLPQNNMVFAL